MICGNFKFSLKRKRKPCKLQGFFLLKEIRSEVTPASDFSHLCFIIVQSFYGLNVSCMYYVFYFSLDCVHHFHFFIYFWFSINPFSLFTFDLIDSPSRNINQPVSIPLIFNQLRFSKTVLGVAPKKYLHIFHTRKNNEKNVFKAIFWCIRRTDDLF